LDANADEKRGHDKEEEADSLAQLGPGNLVDSEDWEANYQDQKSQLNKQRVRDRHVWAEKLDADADEKGRHNKEGEANSLAQVRPGDPVDSEEWETNYHNQKAQLKEQCVRDRHVWGKKLDSDANKKSGSGSTPTRHKLESPKQVRRGHNEEGEADSLAQVCPGNLKDSEEWEANYHNQKWQLNKQRVRDRHVWGEKLDTDAAADFYI
jgi:hypothetical protein